MTDTTDSRAAADEILADAMARAVAETFDGRAVLMVQETAGTPVRWFVPDARYSDGWREVTDRDEIGALVADINTHQAETAGPVTSGSGPDPVLVKGDDGASHIGTGLAPEDSTGGGADDPEGVQAGGEATPTAGTEDDDDG